MLDVKNMFGLVVMDARDANIALLKGKRIVPLVKTHSHVPGKMKAGGQSSHRFQANRDLAVKGHMKKIADYMKEQFLNRENLKGILVGGPGPNKHDFVDSDFITNDVKKKIIAVKDLSYTGDFGVQELVDRCQDVLAQEEIADEKKILGRFFNLLSTKEDYVTYGDAQVRMALAMGAVEVLILSESLEDEVIDEFDEIARKFSTDVKIVSIDTREGVQLRDIGKIAAILRYPVNI
jgi:peptide chain release factor subunit 1